jgi:hypothetical protein
MGMGDNLLQRDFLEVVLLIWCEAVVQRSVLILFSNISLQIDGRNFFQFVFCFLSSIFFFFFFFCALTQVFKLYLKARLRAKKRAYKRL